MTTRAQKAVIEGADWLTAAEIAELSGFSANDADAVTGMWIERGLIFSVAYCGNEYFPGYGLDSDHGFRPFTSLKAIIACFNGSKSGWGLAYWFGSLNSFLGAKCPKDLLACAPERVLAAACDEMGGVVHA